MSDIGKLCYRANGVDAGKLCYKSSGADAGKLVFKVHPGDWTIITSAWDLNGRDLDICAYWTGAPNMVMGFGHNTSQNEQISGPYHIIYSGDKQGVNEAEWVKVKMEPWDGGYRTFNMHFNFYGYDASSYPASKCIVIASQVNGNTIILPDVSCSTRTGNTSIQPNPGIATTSDPGVRVTFDSIGYIQSVEAI